MWRPAQEADLPGIVALAALIHPDHPERPEVFADRLALHKAGVRVFARADMLQGYVIAHPWQGKQPPKLNTVLGRLPEIPDRMLLHDLAFHPAMRGGGNGAVAVRSVERQAAGLGLCLISLVSVGGSLGFWRRAGFTIDPEPTALDGYGATASLMHKTVGRRSPY